MERKVHQCNPRTTTGANATAPPGGAACQILCEPTSFGPPAVIGCCWRSCRCRLPSPAARMHAESLRPSPPQASPCRLILELRRRACGPYPLLYSPSGSLNTLANGFETAEMVMLSGTKHKKETNLATRALVILATETIENSVALPWNGDDHSTLGKRSDCSITEARSPVVGNIALHQPRHFPPPPWKYASCRSHCVVDTAFATE